MLEGAGKGGGEAADMSRLVRGEAVRAASLIVLDAGNSSSEEEAVRGAAVRPVCK